MAKQSDTQKRSPFDALRIARLPEVTSEGAATAVAFEGRPEGREVRQGGTVKPLAKSLDPEYVKFTTYVKKRTHLAVKARLVAQEKELSELVEELLTSWLTHTS